MIKYLGSKRTLLPTIIEIFKRLAPAGTVVDLFSGTSRVGHAAKAVGFGIHNPSGEVVGEVSHLRNKELLFVSSRNST